MNKFEFLEDLTSDVMFKSYGESKEELFENSALALFTIICEIDKVSSKKEIEIEVNGENLEDLLFNWLTSLIAFQEIEQMFFSKFKILSLTDKKIIAKLCGEDMTKEKGLTHVKAITYYKYKVEKKKVYEATVTCDI
jgi:SHS2 domain-containing protein